MAALNDDLAVVMRRYRMDVMTTCAGSPLSSLAARTFDEIEGRLDEPVAPEAAPPATAAPEARVADRPPPATTRFGEANRRLRSRRDEALEARRALPGSWLGERLSTGQTAIEAERKGGKLAHSRTDSYCQHESLCIFPASTATEGRPRTVLRVVGLPKAVCWVRWEVRLQEGGRTIARSSPSGDPVSPVEGAILDTPPVSVPSTVLLWGLDHDRRVVITAEVVPEIERRGALFHAETCLDMDFDEAIANEGRLRREFIEETARLYGVSPEAIQIIRIDRGSTVIQWTINPAAHNILPCVSALLYPQFDRSYLHTDGQVWAGDVTTRGARLTTAQPLIRGGEPYWCPLGWKRFALFVDGVNAHPQHSSHTELPTGWAIAYHGTKAADTGVDPADPAATLDIPQLILKNGFRPSAHGCYLPAHWGGALYTSPSIEYAANDQYAKPFVEGDKWYQIVFQLKVNKAAAIARTDSFIEDAETLCGWDYDPNFNRTKLEWLFRDLHDVKLCGIMVRSGNVADLGPKDTVNLHLRGRPLQLAKAGKSKIPTH